MPDNTPRLYDGLFLVNMPMLGGDLNAALELIRGILEKAECEIITLGKWDERKLTYAIDGQKRGTYLLTYFKAVPTQIAQIERDCNLTETVSKFMMLRADHVGEAEMTLAIEADKDAQVAASLQATEPAESAEPEAVEAESSESSESSEPAPAEA